jgi:hypothetical protein
MIEGMYFLACDKIPLIALTPSLKSMCYSQQLNILEPSLFWWSIRVYVYLHIRVMKKITRHHQRIQKTPSEKNVPKGSFAYLRICFPTKEITA